MSENEPPQLGVDRIVRETIPAATVWRNQHGEATWHTWDQQGGGGENDVEHEATSDESCKRARIEAAASAIDQGFI